MSDCSLSPKRKASQTIGSPSKRVTLGVNSDIEKWTPEAPNGEASINIDPLHERTIPDIPIGLQPVWRPVNGGPVDVEFSSSIPNEPINRCLMGVESSFSDSNDIATTIGNDGLFILRDGKGKMRERLKPPVSEDYTVDLERGIPSVFILGVDGGQNDAEFPPLDGSAEDDITEFGYMLSSKEYVELHIEMRVTRSKEWAKVIDVSCTYAGVEVASASGHFICREIIRDNFYGSMDLLGKPVSGRIDELFDHHGYFRWSIKEYYLGQKAGSWNDALDTGSILLIDEVLVNKEWQSQALGALMVTSLIDRAEKRDCAAKLAFVLPSTSCFWKVKKTGINAFDKSQSWAEQNHVRLFLGVGFTRVARTGWFVLDIAGEDEESWRGN
jgi:hypothetical protein